ncbi:glycosyltransferase [Diaphorobacter caeni]|uniref:glycosyltransferase n=1 Tax=Diaphorobacter caeni TaxID=2784387 RepID=UPI00188DF9AA|nr:glycosyltransferase family 4 protein [Diaphorobacter caeni]MBF5003503.1 glycosyltransferase [Diaphorobacter caeni]
MQYRTGAELFVRDIALALNQRGHSIIVFSPIMGDMVDELRTVCIACVSDLTQIAEVPDIIIGNTRDETVACLALFLGVPAMFVCHDRTASHGRPPLFSRIRQHVAVDENCAERLYLEHGIPRSSIELISNGVDLTRFKPRAPLPDKPLRAAIFSNDSTEHQDTRAIRAACLASDISLDVIGAGVGQQACAPEDILSQYDLVFAKARCAMEAMAVGCAVILFNQNMGLAGMVKSSHVKAWQAWNFGRRLLRCEVSETHVSAAISEYDATDAQMVSEHVRTHLSLDATASKLEHVAWRILQQESSLAPVSPEIEIREFTRHCMDNLLPFGAAYLAAQTGMARERIESRDTIIRQRQEQMVLLERVHEASIQALREAGSRELTNAINQLYERERHIQALLASKSWRVTAPLRWLAARLGIQ